MEEHWFHRGECLLAEIDRTITPPGCLALWFLGQEGLVVKGSGLIVYIDPWLSDVTANVAGHSKSLRKYPPPYDPGQVCHADFILGTHAHGDHIDLKTLRPLMHSSPQACCVVPAPARSGLVEAGLPEDRVIPARAGEQLDLNGMTVHPVPAYHDEPQMNDESAYRALGYILELNGVTLYHAGDTLEYPELVSLLVQHKLDIACLPINGDDLARRRRNIIGNMNSREAVEVGRAAGAKLLIPLHYDLFAGNTENPAAFVDYLYRTYPAQPFKVLAPGERFLYMA